VANELLHLLPRDSHPGRLCTDHLSQVLAHMGRWGCAWPGCQRLLSAGRGLCSFHVAVAAGRHSTDDRLLNGFGCRRKL
jgi:hypothetical protein